MDALPWLLLVLVVVGAVLVGLRAATSRRLRELEGQYEDVLASQGLTMTDQPCGFSDDALSAFDLLPAGDRRASAVWGAEGVELVRLDGVEVQVTCAAFEWWWEDLVTASSRPGHERSSRLVALVRFPADAGFAVSSPAGEDGELSWEWRAGALAVALPASPRGIIRTSTATDDLVSTSPAAVEALPELRTRALALAARLVRPA